MALHPCSAKNHEQLSASLTMEGSSPEAAGGLMLMEINGALVSSYPRGERSLRLLTHKDRLKRVSLHRPAIDLEVVVADAIGATLPDSGRNGIRIAI